MNRKVVITGWGQVTQPKEQTSALKDPLGLMAESAKKAAEIAGSLEILINIDAIMVVRVMSRHIPSAAKQLAQKLGAAPRFTEVSAIGGNSPQSLVNKAAGMISRGELDSVLISGGEAYYPRKASDTFGNDALFKGLTGDNARDDMIGVTLEEMQHGIYLPLHGFPFFETALWADSGLDIAAYSKTHIGKMWSTFSHTAAKHPNAWLHSPKTAEDICTVSATNRMIAFPYTKFMNPIITVDLGAAIILMSKEKADQYKQNNRQPVYFLGGAYTQDRQQFLIEKSDFTTSLPIKTAAERALSRSKITLEEIDCFDIYSCFPCSVSIAEKMIGLKKDDPRPRTLTGGLGFFGGPGNNYSLHSIATLADMISTGQFQNGMITSLGWFLHKNAIGIYSTNPADTMLSQYDLEDEADFLVGAGPVNAKNKATGAGTIETYTVIYSPDGTPDYGVIYGKTDDGFRFIAHPSGDKSVLEALTTKNIVGQPVLLTHNDQLNKNMAELLYS